MRHAKGGFTLTSQSHSLHNNRYFGHSLTERQNGHASVK